MENQVSPSVLIIEDDQTIAQMLALMLKLQGYQAVLAANGHLALQLLDSVRPALITLDLNMPGLSGEEFLRVLRSDRRRADLPVIVITAQAHIPSFVYRESQALLSKPFSLEELSEAVVLARGPRLAEREVGGGLMARAVGQW